MQMALIETQGSCCLGCKQLNDRAQNSVVFDFSAGQDSEEQTHVVLVHDIVGNHTSWECNSV